MSADPTLLACFGHHKCASAWGELLCGEVCRELHRRFAVVFEPGMFDRDLARFVNERGIEFLAYSNADYQYVRQLPLDRVRGFHLVRDPRDIVVSAYFSHRNSHPTGAWPELVAHRDALRGCSKEEGLFLELDFRAQQFQEMRSWRDHEPAPNVRLVRMEELTADPYRGALDLMSFLGLVDEGRYSPSKRVFYLFCKVFRRLEFFTGQRVRFPIAPGRLPAERLLGIVWENDFQRKAGGRKPGQEDPNSHYRKGVPGDWRHHFTAEHVRVFKERYGDLVLDYGYETSDTWDLDTSTREVASV